MTMYGWIFPEMRRKRPICERNLDKRTSRKKTLESNIEVAVLRLKNEVSAFKFFSSQFAVGDSLNLQRRYQSNLTIGRVLDPSKFDPHYRHSSINCMCWPSHAYQHRHSHSSSDRPNSEPRIAFACGVFRSMASENSQENLMYQQNNGVILGGTAQRKDSAEHRIQSNVNEVQKTSNNDRSHPTTIKITGRTY